MRISLKDFQGHRSQVKVIGRREIAINQLTTLRQSVVHTAVVVASRLNGETESYRPTLNNDSMHSIDILVTMLVQWPSTFLLNFVTCLSNGVTWYKPLINVYSYMWHICVRSSAMSASCTVSPTVR